MYSPIFRVKRLVVGDTFQIVSRFIPLIFSDHVDVVVISIWFNKFHRCIKAKIFIGHLDWLMRSRRRIHLFWLTRVLKRITPSSGLDIFDYDFRAFWRSVFHHVVEFATWFSQGIPHFGRDRWVFMLLQGHAFELISWCI